MSRQPRFIDDDEPIRRRGSHAAHFEDDPADAAPQPIKTKKPVSVDPIEDEVDRILREEAAKAKAQEPEKQEKPEPSGAGRLDDSATRQFTLEKQDRPAEKAPDETKQFTLDKRSLKEDKAPGETRQFTLEKRDRYDGDDEARGSEYISRGSGGKKIALIILAIVLGFAILGSSVYALVHFVLSPDQQTSDSDTAVTEAPTLPEEPTLTPDPTQPPTEAPTAAPAGAKEAALADAYMKDLSARDKMCQLFIVTPEALTAGLDDSEDSDATAVTVAGEMTKKSLEEYPVGGIIYFGDNIVDESQLKSMISNSQKYAKTPLFISVDEEGGDVARVADKLKTKTLKPMMEYKDKGASTAYNNAYAIASYLAPLGFNMDNAPVADVLSNPDNTVIGKRAYSDDYEQAAELVRGAVQGFNDGGVISVLKHFPGHGSTAEDSHEGLAYVKTTAEDLKKNELLPFKKGIEVGADMVMVGHLIVSDLDADLPATLSSKVVPELLRKELGYDGIVISDSMSMGAITDNYDYEAIVKGLFAADVDIILQPDNLDKYLDSMESLLESGAITQEQIDAKVKKILTLKYTRGIMTETAAQPATKAPSAAEATEAAEETSAEETAEETPDDTEEEVADAA